MKKQWLLLWVQSLLSWCQAKRKLLMVIGIIVLVVGVIAFVVCGYVLKWTWTGFTAQVGPNEQQYQPTKTVWDWLQLLGVLAIPVVAAWFTAQLGNVRDAENTDNQRERALQDYINKMSDLLLKEHLHESSNDNKGIRQIARIRTLTVLRRLDAERKGNVIQFLQEAGLIKEEAILDLARADLRKADLREANLIGANLRKTSLSGANLSGAFLSYANLGSTDLSGAFLSYANLRSANLSGADLSGADLSGATIAQEQLQKAKSLQGATMPDGSKHP